MCVVNVSLIVQGKKFPDAGAALFDIINPAFDNDDTIVLDMKDVDLLPSMFLNTSIGRIIKERGKAAMSKFSFRNISRVQLDRLRDYVRKLDA